MSSSDAGVRVPRGEIALRERLIDKGDCVDRQGMRSESGLIVPANSLISDWLTPLVEATWRQALTD